MYLKFKISFKSVYSFLTLKNTKIEDKDIIL